MDRFMSTYTLKDDGLSYDFYEDLETALDYAEMHIDSGMFEGETTIEHKGKVVWSSES